jgi:hypothetical protein
MYFIIYRMPIPFSEEEETLAAAATPWSVSSTHTNLDQNITSSTALTTSGGTVGYYNEFLQDDHNLTLPSAGTITHFVSPQQPVFTFTAPTRVSMIIPGQKNHNLGQTRVQIRSIPCTAGGDTNRSSSSPHASKLSTF